MSSTSTLEASMLSSFIAIVFAIGFGLFVGYLLGQFICIAWKMEVRLHQKYMIRAFLESLALGWVMFSSFCTLIFLADISISGEDYSLMALAGTYIGYKLAKKRVDYWIRFPSSAH